MSPSPDALPAVDLARLPRPILDAHPRWIELYDFAWSLAARNRRRGKTGRWYMDCAWDPSRNYQWVWDTSFMCMYCRFAPEQYPGIQSLDNFYDLQRADGYIGMTYDMDTGSEPWPDRINPPLFAWAEREYVRTTGDTSRLARVIPRIEQLMGWIDANRRTEPHRRLKALDNSDDYRGGTADPYRLYYFEDGGSSGMDDAPRSPRVAAAGQHFDWIDLSSQMALSFSCLAELNAAAGQADRSADWRGRAGELGELINSELWCERSRFYHDRCIPRNFLAHKTVAGFWPILAGICPPERLDALVAHLRDEREFNRPTPVPSLSADDINYDPNGTYWVGGVWAPTNYMVTRGLMTAGRGDVAHEIADRYMGVLARTYEQVEPHTLWEAYSPEADLPGLAAYTTQRVKPHFVGWTGVGPIVMLIENIIGIDLDLVAHRATWDVRLTERHGVRQLRLGSGLTADFLCEPRNRSSDPAAVTVRSDADLSVTVNVAGRSASGVAKARQELKMRV